MTDQKISHDDKIGSAKRHMLLVSMASMVMIFAALTSAYIVRKDAKDWEEIQLPSVFFFSTVLIILSSFVLHYACVQAEKGFFRRSSFCVLMVFSMGVIFSYLQFEGFDRLVEKGIFFTGSKSKISGTFVYVLTVVHLAHLFAGLIGLTFSYVRRRGGRHRNDVRGLWNVALFWHFLGGLWVYLYAFMYFA